MVTGMFPENGMFEPPFQVVLSLVLKKSLKTDDGLFQLTRITVKQRLIRVRPWGS